MLTSTSTLYFQVTKEYPYSECTNQAQIYRKVTQGIKPQSLEQVQDAETREFINRCLDHDDRTRPSAQELLDSDFLLPCASAPPLSTATIGLFHHPTRPLTTDGMEFMDGPLSSSATTLSNRSSLADPFLPSTSPTSTHPKPSLPSVLRTQPLPVKAHPQPITIPTAEFTTTTVDADNKTYHIRSNLLPQTPTSDPAESTQEEQAANPGEVVSTQSEEPETPTLHSHANSKTCCIQVLQYGEAVGNHLNLKMICTCPVAGPRDVTVAAGTHEIKFPFDLDVDTVEEVVAEMIREQILSGDDREEATSRIQELVNSIVSARTLAKETKVETRAKDIDHGRKNNKNGRQLNVPPAGDMDQYGTSPTESVYDHYSSVGSSASIGWHGVDSPIESDQGYGTVHHPTQNPPVITESTFPPLNQAHPPKSNFSLPAERYSDVVQHPVALPAHHPLSPLLVGRDRAASVPTQRPLSALYLDQRSAQESKVTTTTRNKDDDVGYTSPYRHGVSSSSITSHRRSPSVDAAVMIASAPLVAPTPNSHPVLLATNGSKSLEADMGLLSVNSYQGVSGMTPDIRSPSRELAPMLTHSELLHHSQHPISPDSGISSATSSLSEPTQSCTLAPLSLLSHGIQERLPRSANPVHIEPQHSHRHAFAPSQANGGSVILMTSEAKNDIEQWSNKVQHPADHHTSGYNGSNYSSCPELSDDEEVLDDDLKILRERHRQELELMRLQHEQQWEKMMKLKEQKSLRKSEATSPPPSVSTHTVS